MKYFDKIQKDMYIAMKEKDQNRVATLRTIISILKSKSIDKGSDLSVDEQIKELKTFAKQRKEAIEMFQRGGRADLVKNEENELKIVEDYLPQMMDEDSLRDLVKKVISEVGATKVSDMGKIMPLVMKSGKGLIDGKLAQLIVQELLS